MEVLARALVYMESRAAAQPSLERLVRAAIRGMLREVDGSSRYLSVEELERWEHSAEGGEVGLGLEAQGGGFRVSSVEEGLAAQKAGIRVGDLLLSIDEQPVQGLSAAELRGQLLGPVGSQVWLKLKREGLWQPLRLKLTRISPGLPPLETHWADAVWVVRLRRFSSGVALELSQRLSEALERKPAGIVLDLRGNWGGLLQEAFGIASLFLPPQTSIVRIQNPQEGLLRIEKTVFRRTVALQTPLLVLMDRNSASVTEVLLAALKDNGRARLVGERSYGKGSIQEKLLLPDGSALYLTVAYFIRLTGGKIDGEGVLPDCDLNQPKACRGFGEEVLEAQGGAKDIWLEWGVKNILFTPPGGG